MTPSELLAHAQAEVIRLRAAYESASISALMSELDMQGAANVRRARRIASALRDEYNTAVAKWQLLGGRFI